MSSTPSKAPRETRFDPSKNTLWHQAENSRPARKVVPERPARTRRRPVPTPIDTNTRTKARFAIGSETSRESSPDGCQQDPVPDPVPDPEPRERKPRRRSREKFAEDWEVQCQKPRHAEEQDKEMEQKPVEKKPRSSREKFAQDWESQTASGTEKRPPRKFSPQLVETAKRSRRSGASSSVPFEVSQPAFRNDSRSPTKNRRVPPSPPMNTPTVDMSHNPLFLEIQRATSPSTRRRPSWASLHSQHSFRVPELEPIESSESEPPSPASPVLSRSVTASNPRMYIGATSVCDSVDEKASGNLLELAAQAAEKQLRDQANAAFPNDDHHEHVDHFVDRADESPPAEATSDETAVKTFTDDAKSRRESMSGANNWEMLAMQRFRAKMEKHAESERAKQKLTEAPTTPTNSFSDNTAAMLTTLSANKPPHDQQQDKELKHMLKSASPPLLGADIEFPRCESPEEAHFDPTQGCDAAKMAQGYLSRCASQVAEKGESLWCGNNMSSRPSFYSNPVSHVPSRSSSPASGLWGGSCKPTGGSPTPSRPTGLMTPRLEVATPASPFPTPAGSVLKNTSLYPPTPQPSSDDFASINSKLAAEAAIEEDFNDAFVTQVYNYLSLGYPSVARMFDEELSKISHIPVEELRQDDHLPSKRGYIRLGEDNEADSKISEESCMRWRALKEYVKVWARQHPQMAAESPLGRGTATTVRKGSWAF